jgi:hypothetical protein
MIRLTPSQNKWLLRPFTCPLTIETHNESMVQIGRLRASAFEMGCMGALRGLLTRDRIGHLSFRHGQWPSSFYL